MVLIAGFLHVMFIMYDNMYYNSENGFFTIMPETLNESMSSDTANDSWNSTLLLRDVFGYGRVIVIALVPVCLGIAAIDKPRIEG